MLQEELGQSALPANAGKAVQGPKRKKGISGRFTEGAFEEWGKQGEKARTGKEKNGRFQANSFTIGSLLSIEKEDVTQGIKKGNLACAETP